VWNIHLPNLLKVSIKWKQNLKINVRRETEWAWLSQGEGRLTVAGRPKQYALQCICMSLAKWWNAYRTPKYLVFCETFWGRGSLWNGASLVKRCKTDGKETFTDVLQTLNKMHYHRALSRRGTSYVRREGNNHDYQLKSANDAKWERRRLNNNWQDVWLAASIRLKIA